MSKTRQILAVMAVTTALCADHVASAAPVSRGPVTEMAGRLVTRLTQSFRRVIPSAVRSPVRQQRLAAPMSQRFVASASALPVRQQLDPFQFRLPPPIL
jgi:hypothetical protein